MAKDESPAVAPKPAAPPKVAAAATQPSGKAPEAKASASPAAGADRDKAPANKTPGESASPKGQAKPPRPAAATPPVTAPSAPMTAPGAPKTESGPANGSAAAAPSTPKSVVGERVTETLLDLFETGFKKRPPPPVPLIKVGGLNLTPKNTDHFDRHIEDVLSRAADGALLGAVNAIARPIKQRLIRTMVFAVIWALAIAYGLHEASNAHPLSGKDLLQIGLLAVGLPGVLASYAASRALR